MNTVTVTANHKKEGQRIAKELGVTELHMNSKGEFFTEKNRALLSEGNTAANVATLQFEPAGGETTSAASTEDPAITAGKRKLSAAKNAVEKHTKALNGIKEGLEKKPEDKKLTEKATAKEAELKEAEAELAAAEEELKGLTGETEGE